MVVGEEAVSHQSGQIVDVREMIDVAVRVFSRNRHSHPRYDRVSCADRFMREPGSLRLNMVCQGRNSSLSRIGNAGGRNTP